MTKLLEIKLGTYVTPKVGGGYVSFSDDIRLVKGEGYWLDDENSVAFDIEQGSITECDEPDGSLKGRTWEAGQSVFLGMEDIAIIHA